MEEDKEDIRRLNEIIITEISSTECTSKGNTTDYTDSSSDSEDDDEVSPESYMGLLRSYLTREELSRINMCTDTDIRNLMILNRVKYIEFNKIHHEYEQLYSQVLDVTTHCGSGLVGNNTVQAALKKVSYPYFKDKQGFGCAIPNSDKIRKKARGEILPHYYISSNGRRWTRSDQVALKSAVRLNYFQNKQEKLERELKVVKIKLKTAKVEKELNEEIETIEQQLQFNQTNYTNKIVPPLGSSDSLDWNKISIVDLNTTHSPTACMAMWNSYSHPDINNSVFTPEENAKIHLLAKENDYQNWDVIALGLNNNRNPFRTAIHYFTSLYDKFTRAPFTKEEDDRLLQLIKQHKIKLFIPWRKISTQFKNRSKNQLYMHYMYNLASRNLCYTGMFTEEEDLQIYYLVKKHGMNFSVIAQQMNRTALQVRNRYCDYLNRDDQRQGTWTVAEDKVLLQYVEEFGENTWYRLVDKLNRSRTMIRQRYVTIKKHLALGKSIEDLPRRKHSGVALAKLQNTRQLAEELHASNTPVNLNRVVNDLKTKHKHDRVGRPLSKRDFIDDQLIDFFKTSTKLGRTYVKRTLHEDTLQQCAKSIQNVFTILNVQLEIPDNEITSGMRDLDEIDESLLSILRESSSQSSESGCKYLMPPNCSNLSALRGLIYKDKSSRVKLPLKPDQITKKFTTELQDFPEVMQTEVLKHRSNFIHRFQTLFFWPSMLSLNNVHSTLSSWKVETIQKALTEKLTRPVGRPRKKKNDKIEKMLKARNVVSKCKGKDEDQPGTSGGSSLVKKHVLNEKVATSVEEVKELWASSSVPAKENVLIRIDKETMRKLQLQQKMKKKISLGEVETAGSVLGKRKLGDSAEGTKRRKIEVESDEEVAKDINSDILLLDSMIKEESNVNEDDSNNDSDSELEDDISKLDNILLNNS